MPCPRGAAPTLLLITAWLRPPPVLVPMFPPDAGSSLLNRQVTESPVRITWDRTSGWLNDADHFSYHLEVSIGGAK